jgi:hypothetical protein
VFADDEQRHSTHPSLLVGVPKSPAMRFTTQPHTRFRWSSPSALRRRTPCRTERSLHDEMS